MPQASIIISSHNRLGLFRRTLWGIANRGPTSMPYEVVVVDDGSTEDVLGELKLYSSKFLWKFIRFDATEFERTTGLKKFLNNPCVTNNIALQHSEGDYIYQQGNEVIPWVDCYDRLLSDIPSGDESYFCKEVEIEVGLPAKYFMVMSTTYDFPAQYLDTIDLYGSNLTQDIVNKLSRWPLQSEHYRSDVTNYISLAPRELWLELNGYDERYYGGISAEDSDFVRRARKLPGFKQVISPALSLHQFHHGKSAYYNPPRKYITQERWDEGVAINHAIYNSWDNTFKNPQKWPWGKIGVKEILSNGK